MDQSGSHKNNENPGCRVTKRNDALPPQGLSEAGWGGMKSPRSAAGRPSGRRAFIAWGV